MAAKAGAKGLVVINNSTNAQECLYLGAGNDTIPAELSSLFVAAATGEQGWSLVNSTHSEETPVEATASFTLLQIPKLDPAALVLLALAVISIVIAAAWTGMEFKEMLARQEQHQAGAAQPESPSRSVPTTFDRGAASSWPCLRMNGRCLCATHLGDSVFSCLLPRGGSEFRFLDAGKQTQTRLG